MHFGFLYSVSILVSQVISSYISNRAFAKTGSNLLLYLTKQPVLVGGAHTLYACDNAFQLPLNWDSIEAIAHMDLNTSNISSVLKLDDRQAVLDFVKSQRSFSKVHAAEGKAYMASWKGETEITNSILVKAHPAQSCGFSTPVLKPRIRPTKKLIPVDASDRKRRTESTMKPDARSEYPNKRHLPMKSGGRVQIKEERFRSRRKRSSKRGRDLQSDEEKSLWFPLPMFLSL